jgi:hypothetical protein
MARSDRALLGLAVGVASGCSALIGADFGEYGPEGEGGGAAQSSASTTTLVSSASSGDAVSTSGETTGAAGGGEGGGGGGTVATSTSSGPVEEDCDTAASESDEELDNGECGALLGGRAAIDDRQALDTTALARVDGRSGPLLGGSLVQDDEPRPFLWPGEEELQIFEPTDQGASVRALLPIPGGVLAAGWFENADFLLDHDAQRPLLGFEAGERAPFISQRDTRGEPVSGRFLRASPSMTTPTRGWIEALGIASNGELVYAGITDGPLPELGVFTPRNQPLEGGQYFFGRMLPDLTEPLGGRLDWSSAAGNVCSTAADGKADGFDMAIDVDFGIWLVGAICGTAGEIMAAADDGFIAYLEDDGQLVPRALRGVGLEDGGRQTPKAVAAARDDHVVVGGDFRGRMSMVLDGASRSLIASDEDDDDAFVAACSYADEIVCRWGVQLGGTGSQLMQDVHVDPVEGTVYVLGAFVGATTLAGVTFGAGVETYGTFLLKLDPDGEPIWVRWLLPDAGEVRPGAVVGRPDGGVTISGVLLGTLEAGDDVLTSAASPAPFYVDVAP